jgi:hypothetical protein
MYLASAYPTRANASNSTRFAMNLPNRCAAKLILLRDLRVRVRVRVRISGENRTRTPTRTLPSLKLDAFALRLPLIGKKVNEKFEVEAPAGKLTYKIVSIA